MYSRKTMKSVFFRHADCVLGIAHHATRARVCITCVCPMVVHCTKCTICNVHHVHCAGSFPQQLGPNPILNTSQGSVAGLHAGVCATHTQSKWQSHGWASDKRCKQTPGAYMRQCQSSWCVGEWREDTRRGRVGAAPLVSQANTTGPGPALPKWATRRYGQPNASHGCGRGDRKSTGGPGPEEGLPFSD